MCSFLAAVATVAELVVPGSEAELEQAATTTSAEATEPALRAAEAKVMTTY
jgi:hypothetical protein